MGAHLLKKLVHALVEHRVECVVVGGYAVMAQGSALVTQDGG